VFLPPFKHVRERERERERESIRGRRIFPEQGGTSPIEAPFSD